MFYQSIDVHPIFVFSFQNLHEMFMYCQFHPKNTIKLNKIICFIYQYSVNDILRAVGTYFKSKTFR